MDKQEFIDGMRSALNGKISSAQLEETIDYYRDYINVEMRKGKSEQEVLELLGDPRLIARTIIQTSGSGTYDYSDPEPQEVQRDAGVDIHGGRIFPVPAPGWIIAAVFLLLFLLILCIIFSILSFLAPIIVVVAAVVLLTKIFRDWLH